MEPTLNQLLSDPHFIDLDILLNKFNVFRSIKAENMEIRHSKFFAYLLSPYETHGLGTEFISNFLLCLNNRVGDSLDITQFDLDLTEVITEWSTTKAIINEEDEEKSNGRLDILVRIPLRYKRDSYFDLAIELKWKSKQHKGQLKKYSDQLIGKLKSENQELIFLTLDGEEPESEANQWKSITYLDVVIPALKNTLKKKRETSSPKVTGVLEDWLDILETASSQELDRKGDVERNCEQLLNYGEVLKANSDFLRLKHASSYDTLTKFIEESKDIKGRVLEYFKSNVQNRKFTLAYSNRAYLRFYPALPYPFSRYVGGFASLDDDGTYPLIWEINVKESEGKLKTRLFLVLAELCDEFNLEDRRQIANSVRDTVSKNEEWSFTNTEITNYFTRLIRSKWVEVSNDYDSINSQVDKWIVMAADFSSLIEEKISQFSPKLMPKNLDF